MKRDPGAVFNGLTILRRTEVANFSSVYQVRDTDGRELSLHWVPEDLAEVPGSFAEAFLRRAAALAQLRHAHLLRVYDVGRSDGICWLLTEVAPQSWLSDLIKRESLGRPRALSLLKAAAAAVDYLHANGVVHGGLTPGDIRVDDRAIVVNVAAEWIATRVAGDERCVGNPRYLCPERIKGGAAGRACDVYALGLIACEVLTGRPAFGADSPVAEIARKLNGELGPIAPAVLAERAVGVLRRCLAVEPGTRWPSATTFIAALTAASSEPRGS